MPYVKCSQCRIRVAFAGPEGAALVLSCPDCCGPLESVERLSELIGFRRFDADTSAVPYQASIDGTQRLAAAVAAAMPRRDAAMAQCRPNKTALYNAPRPPTPGSRL